MSKAGALGGERAGGFLPLGEPSPTPQGPKTTRQQYQGDQLNVCSHGDDCHALADRALTVGGRLLDEMPFEPLGWLHAASGAAVCWARCS